MIAAIAARVLLVIMLAPFVVLISALGYALAASQLGEWAAPPAGTLAAGMLLLGVDRWLGAVSRSFGPPVDPAPCNAPSRRASGPRAGWPESTSEDPVGATSHAYSTSPAQGAGGDEEPAIRKVGREGEVVAR